MKASDLDFPGPYILLHFQMYITWLLTDYQIRIRNFLESAYLRFYGAFGYSLNICFCITYVVRCIYILVWKKRKTYFVDSTNRDTQICHSLDCKKLRLYIMILCIKNEIYGTHEFFFSFLLNLLFFFNVT